MLEPDYSMQVQSKWGVFRVEIVWGYCRGLAGACVGKGYTRWVEDAGVNHSLKMVSYFGQRDGWRQLPGYAIINMEGMSFITAAFIYGYALFELF